MGGNLATDHIGSVLVQRARKWDRDHKQIQITAIALEIAADQLCKLNIAIGSGSERNTKGLGHAGNMWGGSCYLEKYKIKIGLVMALGWK